MNVKKTCRKTSNCGNNETCIGAMFGLKAGKCVSNKLRCRKKSQCPKNYVCLGSNLELTEGTCIKSITNDPLSHAMSNVITPVDIYKETHEINWFYIVIFVVILGALGWMIYSTFFQVERTVDGSCGQSAECEDKFGVHYACGSLPSPSSGGMFVCDCSTYASGDAVSSPFPCGKDQPYSSKSNCYTC